MNDYEDYQWYYHKIETLEKENKKLEKENTSLKEKFKERLSLHDLDKKELIQENKKLKEFIEKQSGIEKGERYILEQLYKDMIIISTINNPISELKIEFGIKSFCITQDVKDYLREKGVKYEIRR